MRTAFLALAMLAACKTQEPPPQPLATGTTPVAEPPPEKQFDDYGYIEHYPSGRFVAPPDIDYKVLTPDDIKPLPVIVLDPPTGPGYKKVPPKYGPPIYKGKHLLLDYGRGRFLDEQHLIVNHYDREPGPYGEGAQNIDNLVLNVDTGDVTAHFATLLHADYGNGRLLVRKKDDETPYLLDAPTGTFVRAIPEGTHEYVYGENYLLQFSPVQKHIWIFAEDPQQDEHMELWQDSKRPPPLPDNRFVDIDIDQVSSWFYADPPREDGSPRREGLATFGHNCPTIWFDSAKRWTCMGAIDLSAPQFKPVGLDWFLDLETARVFNERTKAGFDFSQLCPTEEPIGFQVVDDHNALLSPSCFGRGKNPWWWSPAVGLMARDAETESRLTSPGWVMSLDYWVTHEKGVLYALDSNRRFSVLGFGAPSLELLQKRETCDSWPLARFPAHSVYVCRGSQYQYVFSHRYSAYYRLEGLALALSREKALTVRLVGRNSSAIHRLVWKDQ